MKKGFRTTRFAMIGLALTLSIGLAACGNNDNQKMDDENMKNMDHDSMNKDDKK